MFMEERLDLILELIKKEGKVLVKDLSEKFNVSEGMIRKDLQRLEKLGGIRRTYGGAILERKIIHNENTTSRVIVEIDTKEDIGDLVISEIEDDDIIFLDISSTNYIIATKLAEINKRITIITNMNRIALLFDSNNLIDVIFIGGKYNKKLGGTIGIEAIEQIKNYKVDKAFIGAGGVNIKDNFISNFNLDEAGVKRQIIKSSKNNYLVMTNEKFYIDGSYKFSSLEDIDYIITDLEPDSATIESLKKYGIKVKY
ncbi:DeoR/GlpR family DNA-binding transcription regulator [Clostridium carnis]